MKKVKSYLLFFCLCTIVFIGCTRKEEIEQSEVVLPLKLLFDNNLNAKALGDPVHSVNRILVLPFQKLNPLLPDNNLNNYAPLYLFARQWNVASFPVGNLVLKLPRNFAYKVLVIGYNSNDYDFNNQGATSNRFSIGSAVSPTRLDNFHLYPKSPNVVPEFFTCYLTATNGSIVIGTTFTPTSDVNLTLSGQLNRIVSGLTVKITAIPGYVKSISLMAERMVKAIRVSDTIASLVQTTGGTESRLIQKLVPSAGQVLFSNILLPTMTTYKTKLYLNVSYGSVTDIYTIKINDSQVSSDNSIILKPNRVVNISGPYNKINLGFELSYTIKLDDGKWDGLQ
ncbi:hypothetical protein [Gabonibacter chumensis]|uniref:hypothetical protein n=1 Tax=Gabonibacter chumensis TaxID=2972474 RepID=UPI0025735462|nr:hypothetical protein [Gabonibacter chumensis]MCR9011215.1 hypothetical protein [Gabonibacter chumensis]